MQHNDTDHQSKQVKIIDSMEESIKKNALTTSVVDPVEDFTHDPRICLAVVHFPRTALISQIIENITTPLKKHEPDLHYYMPGALHITIKNI